MPLTNGGDERFDVRMNYLELGRKVIDLEIDCLVALRDRLGTEFEKAIEMMAETLWRGNKLVMTGVGKSGHIGSKIAATLTSTGAPCVVLDALDALHGDMGLIVGGDLVFLLSYSGQTEDLLRVVPAIKRLGVKTIAITGNPDSELAKSADLHLNIFVEKEACPLNLAPTSSTTTMLALGDALAMVLLEARGFAKEDFAKYHPGGTLGRNLLLKVDAVMRPLDKVAVCTKEDSVLTSLTRITEKRCGAVIVIEPDGTLAGIYTHGDFARGYQKNPAIGETKLGEVITRNPVSVRVDKLAVEVLNIFERKPIQDLIVLDHDNRPVGLVDVMDLTKFKLI